MVTVRQAAVAAITRRYPLYSGCGSLANHRVVQRLAGPSTETAWARVHGGQWVPAPLGDYVGRAVFYAGELDRKITWICSRLVRPGDTVLDVGANLGLVTAVLSALVGPNGTVHAFEPLPEMQALIDSAVARNRIGNVRLHRVALGAEPGELTLSVPPGHAGSASFVPGRQVAGGRAVRVPVRTLSEVVAEHRVGHVRLVKIDVEGFERQVVEGAREFLSADPPDTVLFELNDAVGDVRRDPTINALHELGYGFFTIPRRLFRMRLDRLPMDLPVDAGVGHDFLAARLGPVYEEVARLVRAT